MAQVREKPTLSALRAHRDAIIRVAEMHGAANIRVFGSVARNQADEASDIDFLVDIVADVHGLAYFGKLEDLRRALESLLGRDVHVLDSAALQRMKGSVLREAVAL